MKLRSFVAGLSLVAAVAMAPIQANALSILVDQINPFSNKIGPDGGDWSGRFTSALASQPNGYTIGSIANAADVASAYAILVVVRGVFGSTPDSLSPTEVTNLTNFIAAGGRVAFIGEGSNIDAAWNTSIVNFANTLIGGGAVSFGADASGTATTAVSNSLTQGVSSVLMQGAGVVAGGGGTPLFSANFATLWGDSIVTVLDMQPFRNLAPAGSGDAVFTENLASWLSDSRLAEAPGETPLPGALPLFVSGIGALGLVLHRRRKKSATA